MSLQEFGMATSRRGYVRGIDDDAVKAKTGKTWREWDLILDAWGAWDKDFTTCARHLRREYEISTWWSNTITARYQWVYGRRD